MSHYQPYDYLFNNQENTRFIVDCTLRKFLITRDDSEKCHKSFWRMEF